MMTTQALLVRVACATSNDHGRVAAVGCFIVAVRRGHAMTALIRGKCPQFGRRQTWRNRSSRSQFSTPASRESNGTTGIDADELSL